MNSLKRGRISIHVYDAIITNQMIEIISNQNDQWYDDQSQLRNSWKLSW